MTLDYSKVIADLISRLDALETQVGQMYALISIVAEHLEEQEAERARAQEIAARNWKPNEPGN